MNLSGKKKLNKLNLLDLTPVRKYEHSTLEDGTIEILIPKFKNKRIEKLLLPRNKSPYFRLHLDETGTATWLSIDGNANVNAICKSLTEKFGEKVQPVEERAGKFITTLYQYGYLDFKELRKQKDKLT